jgi:hypothetical protein
MVQETVHLNPVCNFYIHWVTNQISNLELLEVIFSNINIMVLIAYK